MPWDCSTSQNSKLDWASEFVRERVSPLDITSCIPTDSSTHSTTNCDRSSTR